MNILGELGCFSRPSFSNNNYYSVVPDNGEQFLTHSVHGKEFTLFFDGLGFGEFGDGLVLLAEDL